MREKKTPRSRFGSLDTPGDAGPLAPEDNGLLRQAIVEFHDKRTRRNLSALLKVLQTRAEQGGRLLVPVELDPDHMGPQRREAPPAGELYTVPPGTPCHLRTIQSEGGTLWMSAFTGVEEVKKGETTTVLSYPMSELYRLVLNTEGVSGLVLDPWDKPYPFARELVRVVVTALDETKGKI